MPANKSFEEAIACCDGFLTALPFLRDKGKIKNGNNVLIIGASGSGWLGCDSACERVGAEVTGVCSTSSKDLVKSIGADKVIDYTKQDFTKSGETYDIISMVTGKTDLSSCKKALKINGKFLEAGITLKVFPSILLSSIFGTKKAMDNGNRFKTSC